MEGPAMRRKPEGGYAVKKASRFYRLLYSIFAREDFGLEIKAVWLGFTAALGVWFIAAILGVIWLVIKGEGVYWLGIYLYLTGLLGVFIGGLLGGARADKRGWLHGLWVGILLGMLGIVVNLELAPQAYTWMGVARQFLVWALWGLAGGHAGFHLQGAGSEKIAGRKKGRLL